MLFKFIASLNHFMLVYLVVILVFILGLLLILYIRQHRQTMEVKRMSAKMDELLAQVMLVDPGDYKLKSETFKGLKEKYHDQESINHSR
jgi:hypothetical protein